MASYEIEKKMILSVLKDRLGKDVVGKAERERLTKAKNIIEMKVYEEIPRESIENIKRYLGVYYPMKMSEEG